MKEDQHRHLRRLGRVWVESPVYFMTACTDQRRRILANTAVANILIGDWRAAEERHGWVVGRYVIMPDHVHFFCAAEHNAKTLSEFVRLWKQWTMKGMKAAEPRLASAATAAGTTTARVWQREFFDHVLRSEESYAEKWEYVRQNPVRAGLVARAEDWAFQGEIHSL